VKPRSTDTHLIRTPASDGQFSLSQQLKSSYIFSQISLLNTDTWIMRTLYHVPLVSVLMGFHGITICSWWTLIYHVRVKPLSQHVLSTVRQRHCKIGSSITYSIESVKSWYFKVDASVCVVENNNWRQKLPSFHLITCQRNGSLTIVCHTCTL